jgi:hypothetical protein
MQHSAPAAAVVDRRPAPQIDVPPPAACAAALPSLPVMRGGFAVEPASDGGQSMVADNERRDRWRLLRRVVLNVLAAAAVLVAVPSATLQMANVFPLGGNMSSAMARVSDVDAVRWMRTVPDPSVSPAEAGTALHALFPVTSSTAFRARPTSPPAWPSAQFTALLFADVRTPSWWGPDASRIITRVSGPLSAEEYAFLETMARLPVWSLVDRAAGAAQADVLGGRFDMSLAADANVLNMPVPRFGDVRALAQASVTRAAYYVARKDYAQAELVLRNAASVGLLLVDDSPFIIDALMGRAMLGIVADGLAQLYTLTGNAEGLASLRGFQERARSRNGARSKVSAPAVNLHAARTKMLQDIANTSLPRSARFEQLLLLQWSTCGAPLELLTGSSPVVDAAFAAARQTLASTEAERAYLDGVRRLTDGAAWKTGGAEPLGMVAAAAQVVSAVTGRPQFAVCTRIAAAVR